MQHMLNVRIGRVAALTALSALLATAQAATHPLVLTGRVADTVHYSSEFDGIRYDSWTLPLSGLSVANGFAMGLGDAVHATITLDQPALVPDSASYSIFGFSLSGVDFPSTVLAAISGTHVLFLQGVQVRAGGLGSSAYGQLYNGMALPAPFNDAYAFDTVVSDFTVSAINATAVNVDQAWLSYSVQHPVPEPATWCTLVAGLGLLAAWRFRPAAPATP